MSAFLSAAFHSRRDVPLVLDHFQVFDSVVLAVEVLGSVVEHLELVHVLHLFHFLL